jgi:hypothetical protein
MIHCLIHRIMMQLIIRLLIKDKLGLTFKTAVFWNVRPCRLVDRYHQITWCHIPEESILHFHCHENFRFNKVIFLLTCYLHCVQLYTLYCECKMFTDQGLLVIAKYANA